jgi:hypothetical protein
LTLGNALNGLMNVPYSLMLAQGWTKWIVAQTLIASAVVAPVLYWVVPHYGAISAALLWVAINAVVIFTLIIPHHSRMMPGQMKAWYVDDTIIPVIVAVAISGVGYALVTMTRASTSPIAVLAIGSAFALLAMVGACFAAPSLRPLALQFTTRRHSS